MTLQSTVLGLVVMIVISQADICRPCLNSRALPTVATIASAVIEPMPTIARSGTHPVPGQAHLLVNRLERHEAHVALPGLGGNRLDIGTPHASRAGLIRVFGRKVAHSYNRD